MLDSDVVACRPHGFAGGNADDPECRMLGRIGYLTLECLESATHDIGLAEPQFRRKLVEPAPLSAIEINLDRLTDAFPRVVMSVCHVFMIDAHE